MTYVLVVVLSFAFGDLRSETEVGSLSMCREYAAAARAAFVKALHKPVPARPFAMATACRIAGEDA